MMQSDKIRLDVNMIDNPTNITWKPFSRSITVRLINTDVDLTLELGPDVIGQLKQALSWHSRPQKDAAA